MTIGITTRAGTSEAPAGPPRGRTLWFVALVAAIAAVAPPAPAHAQPPTLAEPASTSVDARWLPWLGCWQLLEEVGPLPESAGELASFADSVLVCVTPASETAAATDVVVTTLADSEQVLVETLSADGLEHSVEETECSGRRRIRWSDDGARLFTRAELACGGEDERRVSAVGFMAGGGTWMSLELVEAGPRAAVTVRRYRRAGDVATLSAAGPDLTADLLARARTAANRAAAADLTIEDVIEAGTEVEPPVLEALLVETDTMFDLDGRTLIRLDDGGVPADVIDLLVALSFPDEFSVQRSGGPTYGGGGGGLGAWGYDPFDTWYPYYAAPFGYYYGWSRYDSLYGYGRYPFVDSYWVTPYYGLDGLDGEVSGPPSEGRVYEGYGYTRLPPDDGRQAVGRAQPRGTSGGGASSGGWSGSSGGGGGGAAAP